MKEALLLVFANKQDIPGGKHPQLRLHSFSVLEKAGLMMMMVISSNDAHRSPRAAEARTIER